MKSQHWAAFLLVVTAIALGGCGGGTSARIGGGSGPSAQVSLLMTDTPPTGVSPLSFQVTLSSVVLNPGNVALLSGPSTVEVTRLQTENALIDNHNVPVGTYTSATVTFSSPVMTFRNDSGSTVTVGGTTCPTATVCTALSPALTNSTVTIGLAGSGVTVAANTPAALLLDLSLSNFLTNMSGTIAADAKAAGAVTVSALTASQGVFGEMEDVVGVVSNVSTSAGTFQLQTALGTYSLTTSTGTSGTALMNFPAAGSCSTASPTFAACVANGQIVSVDMDLLTSNALLATDIFFEDATSSQAEIEGIVIATAGQTPPNQFQMIVLQETPASSGPAIGAEVPVASTSGEIFDVDALGTGTVTNQFSFATVGDLLVGQEVQVKLGTGSTNSPLLASRVRLRSSRVTAQISSVGLPSNVLLNNLPPFFGTAGVGVIQGVVLFPPNLGAYTELDCTTTSNCVLSSPNLVSVRGQLFKNNTSFPMVTTRFVQR
jgi:hypothetical protein